MENTVKNSDELDADLENWMCNLPTQLRCIPIINLAIPGTHDSMTFNITSRSPIAPDAEPILKKLRFLGPILRLFMAKWSTTQTYHTIEQLQKGVRYFDFRIATKQGTDDLFFVHGLYADNIKGPLNEIKSFLETHPREVVIIDCQHFYAFGPSDHERLMYQITSTFGHKLLPTNIHMDHLSLEYLTKQFHYQVICVYRSDAARFGQPLFWPSDAFSTPWPNTDSISKLISTLENNLKEKDPAKGYVSQCILTPTSNFVIRNICSSLKQKCAVPVEGPIRDWINRQVPGKNGVNIIISDFVDMNDTDFCKTVIRLNAKLLN